MTEISFPLNEALAEIRARCLALAQREWAELGDLVDSILPDPLDPIALVPLATGRAVGAELQDLERAAVPLVLENTALRIVDDCADQDDPDALYTSIGLGRAMNAALALHTISAREFSRMPLLQDEGLAAYYRAFLRVCRGQDRDMDERADSLTT